MGLERCLPWGLGACCLPLDPPGLCPQGEQASPAWPPLPRSHCPRRPAGVAAFPGGRVQVLRAPLHVGSGPAHLHVVPGRAGLRAQPGRVGLPGAQPAEGKHPSGHGPADSGRAGQGRRCPANPYLPDRFPQLSRGQEQHWWIGLHTAESDGRFR